MNSRQAWTIQQDSFLKKLVLQNSEGSKVNWSEIKNKFNDRFPARQKTSKQCRERYVNYSAFAQDRNRNFQWSQSQNDTLYEQFKKYGTSWARICQALPGKSENDVKNKFYGSLRKTIRKMNQIGKVQFKKLKKKLRYESVIRAIQAVNCFQNLDNNLKQQSICLRQKIFELSKKGEAAFEKISISELILELNRFNLATRSFRLKKIKRVNDDQDENFSKTQKFEFESGDKLESQSKNQNIIKSTSDQSLNISQCADINNAMNCINNQNKISDGNINICLAMGHSNISQLNRQDQIIGQSNPIDFINRLFQDNCSPLFGTDFY